MRELPGAALRKLGRSFYAQPAIQVAPALIGSILVHRVDDLLLSARIVETEAYVGPHDLAAHSSRGRTRRTQVMFGPPGYAYVYFIYGMHEMFNIVVAADGDAQAVLVRAAEPLEGCDANLSGPGRLARAMRIDRAHNGADLTADSLYLLASNSIASPRVLRAPRVGVDYAEEWKHALLRFYDADSAAVSKPRPRNPQPL